MDMFALDQQIANLQREEAQHPGTWDEVLKALDQGSFCPYSGTDHQCPALCGDIFKPR